MHFQYSPFIVPLVVAAFISSWLGFYSWNRHSSREGIFLSILAIAINVWLWGYILEIAGVDLPTKLFFGKISYLGITAAPLMWFIFAFLHANKEYRLNKLSRILLSVIPAITTVLALTNDWHGLIWSQVGVFREGNFSALQVSHGTWFWVHTFYSYLLLLAGTIYILRSIAKIEGKFRFQSIALLVAVFSPWVGNALYLAQIGPFPYFDLTPFSFTITLLALTWGVLGFQLINLSPIARDYIFEHIEDGMIVLDGHDYITDVNPAARKILNRPVQGIIGNTLEDVFSSLPEYLAKFKRSQEDLGEIKLGEDDPHWYELRLSLLKNKQGARTGSIIAVHEVTARKQTELKLRQLSRAVESSPTSIAITDLAGIIQYINPKFTRLTGYSPQEVYGQSTRILKTEFTPPETYRELWATITAGREWHGEFCNRKKNGEIYWESASISPISGSAGVITHYVAVKEDITEQRQLQERLRKQNESLSLLYQGTLDLFNRHDLNDLLQAIVDQASRLLHSPFVQVVLKLEGELVVRATTSNQAFMLNRTLRRGDALLSWRAHDTQEPVVLKDYSTWEGRRNLYHHLELHAVAEFPVIAGKDCVAILACGKSNLKEYFSDEEIQTGKLFSQLVALILENANLYHSALREIDEREHSQMLLLESENRYRQIIENASDLIYRVDPQGCFVYVNPPTLLMFGYLDEQAFLGKSFVDLAVPEARQAMIDFYENQIKTNSINTYYEFQARAADERTIWLGQNVQLFYEDDRIAGLQAVARDITKRKQVEESLALARDQALEASQFKSQLLAKVSHELRTPLGAILGFSELLQLGTFGPLVGKQNDATQQIIDSVRFLNDVVNDLLDEAQISAQKTVIHMERFSLFEVIKRVDRSMTVLAERKKLHFTLSIAPNLPEIICGDEGRIQQIFVNLAGNAIKYTPSGSVSVHVFCQDSNHWSIQVTDSGIGIPKEAFQYIFEPFRQVDNLMKNNNRGTGLGLTITKQLIELMGGKIIVESEVNKGSTFTVILPLIEDMEKPRAKTIYFNR